MPLSSAILSVCFRNFRSINVEDIEFCVALCMPALMISQPDWLCLDKVAGGMWLEREGGAEREGEREKEKEQEFMCCSIWEITKLNFD